MKRVGFIYDKICDLDNIKLAIKKSSKGKRNQNRVKRILEDIDFYAEKIQQLLINKTYTPTAGVTKTIQDSSSGKIREIYMPRYYPDQIIHWALMLQIDSIISRGMYQYSCGSIPKRGTSYGQKIVRKWMDTDRKNTRYCLKLDVTKFYPSADNEILKLMFRRKIKDPHCLWLIDTIINSAEGLPIGNYTSQWLSNFYLEQLDHYIKQKLGVKYYVRYVDDLVLFGANKKKMHRARKEIEAYLNGIKLQLKDNWQVFRVDKRDIDFLGFRFFRNKTILRKRNALRIRRRVRKIGKKPHLNYRDACAVVSYWGWMKNSDSYNFYHGNIKPIIGVGEAKKVVSRHAKIRNHRRRKAGNKR